MTEMKKCTKCNVTKPLDGFGNSKRSKDGKRNQCKECDKEYRQQNKEKLKEYGQKYNEKNKKKIKEYYQQNKEYWKEWYQQNKDRLKEMKKEYRQQPCSRISCVDKLPPIYGAYIGDDGYIHTKCYKCNEYFTPTNLQVDNTISAFEGKKGNTQNNLYCSDDCKENCEVYGKHPIHYDPDKPTIDRSREVQPHLRKMRLEIDEYKCRRCWNTEDLHCHHYEGVEVNPIESADIDNCITLCIHCHQRVHQTCGWSMKRQSC